MTDSAQLARLHGNEGRRNAEIILRRGSVPRPTASRRWDQFMRTFAVRRAIFMLKCRVRARRFEPLLRRAAMRWQRRRQAWNGTVWRVCRMSLNLSVTCARLASIPTTRALPGVSLRAPNVSPAVQV